MKKFFVIIVCFVATLAAATAQQPGSRNLGTPEERAKSQTATLDSLVKLTADQKTKIEAINLDLAKKMNDAFRDGQGNREDRRAKMEEITAERDKLYKTVLTEEQYKKYSDRREQFRGRQGQGQGRGQGQGQGGGRPRRQ
jgi:Spy/CpxP family protein refolding chaperone